MRHLSGEQAEILLILPTCLTSGDLQQKPYVGQLFVVYRDQYSRSV